MTIYDDFCGHGRNFIITLIQGYREDVQRSSLGIAPPTVHHVILELCQKYRVKEFELAKGMVLQVDVSGFLSGQNAKGETSTSKLFTCMDSPLGLHVKWKQVTESFLLSYGIW